MTKLFWVSAIAPMTTVFLGGKVINFGTNVKIMEIKLINKD
jgi:hypothetical protein